MQRQFGLLNRTAAGLRTIKSMRHDSTPGIITKNRFSNLMTLAPTYPVKPTVLVRTIATTLPTRLHSSSTMNIQDEQTNKVCWKCDHLTSRAAVSCTNLDCGVIQPTVPNLNFYELLSAGTGDNRSEPTFDVDAKLLKRQFLKLQQVAHPDSYSNATKREHKYAEIQSSLLNKAYHTLKDPLARAQYMLAQQGVEVNEAESLDNPELLMDVMEVREELEEAETNDDVERIKQANDDKIKETVGQLSEAFLHKDLELAKDYSIQLQYWENIRRAIIDWVPGKRIVV